MQRYLFGLAIAVCLYPAVPSAQQMVEGTHFKLGPAEFANPEAPAAGSGNAPKTLSLPHRGPGTAKGAILWSHGRGESRAGELAPPLALLFAEREWDVFTLQRFWSADSRGKATSMVGQGIEKVRALGYQRLILIGQSAGAYASVEAIRYGYAADGVISLAHAAFNDSGTGTEWRSNDYGLRPSWEKFGGTKAIVAAAYFDNDLFYEAVVPNVRGPWLRQTLTQLGITHMVIDQPKVARLTGHGAGQTTNFARRFGICLFLLFEQQAPVPCDEGDPAALATFGIKLPPAAEFDPREPYAGNWFGTWSGGRLVAIPIFRRDGTQLAARYLTGHGARLAEAPQELDWPLTLDGDVLRRDTPITLFEFRLGKDGLLEGKRTPKANPAQAETIVMRRAP